MSTAGLPRVLQRTVLAMLCMVLTSTLAFAQDPDDEHGVRADDPALLDAEIMPMAASSLLLDVTRGGDLLVAVGERGHVLHSSDGVQWRQAERVPTRSTLTAVTHHDGRFWAVGHDGVILHASDAAGTWERQRAAPLVTGGFDPEAGVPLLDVIFLDAGHGFAVGAFSLLLETHDGGASWQPRFLSEEADVVAGVAVEGMPAPAAADEDDGFIDDEDDWGFSAEDLMLDAEDDPHLNAIARAGGGGLIIAGERGTLFRSRDDGASWERLALPYEGSMFGVLAWEDGHVMVLGLRGNVFESFDLGGSWQRIDTGTEASMMGGVALPGGGALLVGNEGRMLWRPAQGQPFTRLTHTNEEGETPVLATAVADADGRFIVVGERGVERTASLD
jgi:photosystem II stability/assembly factor-like uncharacterized protein